MKLCRRIEMSTLHSARSITIVISSVVSPYDERFCLSVINEYNALLIHIMRSRALFCFRPEHRSDSSIANENSMKRG